MEVSFWFAAFAYCCALTPSRLAFNFTFPSGTSVPEGGYVVIGNNTQELRRVYLSTVPSSLLFQWVNGIDFVVLSKVNSLQRGFVQKRGKCCACRQLGTFGLELYLW